MHVPVASLTTVYDALPRGSPTKAKVFIIVPASLYGNFGPGFSTRSVLWLVLSMPELFTGRLERAPSNMRQWPFLLLGGGLVSQLFNVSYTNYSHRDRSVNPPEHFFLLFVIFFFTAF